MELYGGDGGDGGGILDSAGTISFYIEGTTGLRGLAMLKLGSCNSGTSGDHVCSGSDCSLSHGPNPAWKGDEW